MKPPAGLRPDPSHHSSGFPLPGSFVELDAGRAHYIDQGKGPVLLLLHPAAGTLYFFKRLLDALPDSFRVIAPDLPGFGYSTASPAFGYRLSDYSDFVRQFVTAMDLTQMTVLVNDSSGPIGLHAASRLSERVSGLVVTDTFGFPLRGRFRLFQWILRYVVPSFPVRMLNRWFNLLPWLVSTIAPMWHPLPKAERRMYQNLFPTHPSRDRILDLLAQLGRDDAFLQQVEQGIQRDLHNKPVLLLYGQWDPARLIGFPAKFRRLFSRVTDAIVPWEEHFPMLGSAGHVAARMVDWYNSSLPTCQQEAKSWPENGPRRESA